MLSNNLQNSIEPTNGDEGAGEPAAREILEQLDRIVNSSLFRNSKRYPSLLRHIVGEALARRGTSLKERTLGIDVFGRDPDYDTNADPVVRISAGEVRKRIAQYYQTRGHEHELRIEIPLGSYQPRFYRALEANWGTSIELKVDSHVMLEAPLKPRDSAPPAEPMLSEPAASEAVLALPPKTNVPRILRPRINPAHLHLALLYGLLFFALIPLVLFGRQRYQSRQMESGEAFFWDGILRSPEPTLIVLGVHSFDAKGNDISYISHVLLPQTQQTLLDAMTRSDMVQLSDLTSYAGVTTLLTQHSHAFYTQGAADTTLEQLRRGPFILIGGFNNIWTTTLTKQLRFRFITQQGGINVLQDSQHPDRIWTLDAHQTALSNTRDFGMVSAFLDHETNQYVLIAAGIGKSGTEAASDFLTNKQGLTAWLESTGESVGNNVQVIIATDVIEGKPGSPRVIASARW